MKNVFYLLFVINILLSACNDKAKLLNSREKGLVSKEVFTPDWESLKKHKATPEWFTDAKIGLYFHWGIYSVPAYGGEWYPRHMYMPDRKGWGEKIYPYHKKTYGEDFDYHDFIPMWKGEKFNAEEIVDLFEKSGAKIIGAIAEHHDGFSLWDSKVNPWNSVKMGPKVNVVTEMAKAAHKKNMKFMTTFHHGLNMQFYPHTRSNPVDRLVDKFLAIHADSLGLPPQDEKYRILYNNLSYKEANDIWLAKLDEVIDEHCPDYIWMDYGMKYISEEHRKQFLANYFNKADSLGKDVLVNTKGDFFPLDLAINNVERGAMPDIQDDVWVTDFTIGAGWSFDKTRRTAIDPNQAIRTICDIVSKNGVVLYDIGPMADGSIPAEQVTTLLKMGEWLKAYGEAIYETRPFTSYGEGETVFEWDENGKYQKGLKLLNEKDFRFTKNGNTVYAIQLGWAGAGKSSNLETFATDDQKNSKIKEVVVLGSDEVINWSMTNDGLKITTPTVKPENADMALVYKIIFE